MTWESIYLTCFFAGLLLTAISFVFGMHLHLPLHVHVHGLHAPHFSRGHSASPFNVASLMMFLTWFGAAGYIMLHYRSAGGAIALTVAVTAGFLGGALMYLFFARVLIANEH